MLSSCFLIGKTNSHDALHAQTAGKLTFLCVKSDYRIVGQENARGFSHTLTTAFLASRIQLRDQPAVERLHPRTPFGIIPVSCSRFPGFTNSARLTVRYSELKLFGRLLFRHCFQLYDSRETFPIRVICGFHIVLDFPRRNFLARCLARGTPQVPFGVKC